MRRDELDELTAHLDAVRGHIDDPSPLLLVQTNWIAGLLEQAGDLTRALPIFEWTLTASERMLGAEHPDTLTSRNNLALTYGAAGRVDEAIALYEQALAACERVLGPANPSTEIARRNLRDDV